jgi:hypothetical protein
MDLVELKERLEREAKKWVGYLDSVKLKETREKELTRLLMETYLRGRQESEK